MKDLYLFIKKNCGLLIFWIKLRNKNTMVPNGIENLFPMIFLVQEGIKELKLLFLVLIERLRKNIIHCRNLEKLFNKKNLYNINQYRIFS